MKLRVPKASRAGMAQFVRFVLVGIVNTGFSYSIYVGLVYAGLAYASANLIALILGILFSFKTQGLFVFKNSVGRLWIRYVIAWGIIYLLNIFLIGRFIAMGFNPYISGAMALPFVTLLSYLAQKLFVFRLSSAQRSPPVAR